MKNIYIVKQFSIDFFILEKMIHLSIKYNACFLNSIRIVDIVKYTLCTALINIYNSQ
jgi:hypothetical protein